MKFRYNFYDVLTLRSNVDLSYIALPVSCVRADNDMPRWDLTVRLSSSSHFNTKAYHQLAYGLYYSPPQDVIVSVLRIFGTKIWWGIRNLLGENTELFFNKNFWILCRYVIQVPFSSICQVSLIVKAILQIKLLLKGHTLLTGAAISMDNRGIIFAGTSGSGKTTTMLAALKHFRSRFISEDIMFLVKNKMYCFPSPIKNQKYSHHFTTLVYTIFHIFPYHIRKYENPCDRFEGRFSESYEGPTDVIFLERSRHKSIDAIQPLDGLNKLCSLNNRVFWYAVERVLASSSYIYDDTSLLNLQKKQFEVLSKYLGNAAFKILRGNNTQDYIELLRAEYGG